MADEVRITGEVLGDEVKIKRDVRDGRLLRNSGMK